MFQSIFELPSQVRSSLDEEDQKAFLDAYNKQSPKTENEVKKALKDAWKACKDLPSSFSFRIIASVEDVDRDREVIDIDSLKKCMDSFIDYGGAIINDHGNYRVGTIWDWAPITKDGMPGVEVWGNLYGGDMVYDSMREAFVKGRNSLSIAGEAPRGGFKCDSKGCYTKRDVKQLMEMSLCRVPANKHCTLQWYNEGAKMTKSADDLTFDVEEYTIHKDYNTCPIMRLKRDLCAIGYDAHARESGVFIPMDYEKYTHDQPIAKSHGVSMVWCPDKNGVMCNDRESYLERMFKDGIEKGYLDEKGYVTDHICKSQFKAMFEADLLSYDGERFCTIFPENTDD